MFKIRKGENALAIFLKKQVLNLLLKDGDIRLRIRGLCLELRLRSFYK